MPLPQMTAEEARAVLGVAAGAGPDELRAAYRSLVRRAHPDLNPAPDATARTVRITTAYAVLLAAPAAAPTPTGRRTPPPADPPAGPPPTTDPPSPGGPGAEVVAIALVDRDTVAVALPPDETLLLVIDTAHALGEVAYLDPSAGLVEAIVEFLEAPTSSVLFTLQGRATGVTDVFCTVEPLSGGDAPPTDAVTRLVLDTMISVRDSRA